MVDTLVPGKLEASQVITEGRGPGFYNPVLLFKDVSCSDCNFSETQTGDTLDYVSAEIALDDVVLKLIEQKCRLRQDGQIFPYSQEP